MTTRLMLAVLFAVVTLVTDAVAHPPDTTEPHTTGTAPALAMPVSLPASVFFDVPDQYVIFGHAVDKSFMFWLAVGLVFLFLSVLKLEAVQKVVMPYADEFRDLSARYMKAFNGGELSEKEAWPQDGILALLAYAIINGMYFLGIILMVGMFASLG